MISLDFLAAIFTLLGVWVVGNKNKYGFIFGICSNLLWIVYVIANRHSYGIAFECLPLFFMNLRNFLKWNKYEQSEISISK
jgi:nicotinamide riboside transporter PnuC